MIGYTLKYLSFDHMILDMPYPTYEIYEYATSDNQDDEVEDPSWTGYSA